jgi:hypothetical protein
MKTLKPDQIHRLSLEELDRRIPMSLEKAQLLQNELTLENKTHADGRVMTDDEYSSWRDRVKTAHFHQLTEYRRLKERRHHIHTNGQESPTKLLQAALEILRDVDDLEPEDLLVCHRIELWLSVRVKQNRTVFDPPKAPT